MVTWVAAAVLVAGLLAIAINFKAVCAIFSRSRFHRIGGTDQAASFRRGHRFQKSLGRQ